MAHCLVLKIKNNLVREAVSEFLGTFTLMILGIGANAMFVFDEKRSNPAVLYLGWGLAVTSGVYVAGGPSGAHLNPAVSFSFAVSRVFPWKKVPVYMLAQYLGAFCACPIMYLTYLDALNHYDGGVRQTEGNNATAGIFGTYPIEQVSVWVGFVDQTVGPAMLVMLLLAITDDMNMKPHKGLIPFAIGLSVTVINCGFGMNCGCALNPARDLSPRIFTAIAGWGVEPFRNYTWFWIPVIAPHIGGTIGAILYVGLIRHHWTYKPRIEDMKIVANNYVGGENIGTNL